MDVEQLVVRAREGEELAFQELVEKHGGFVLSLVTWYLGVRDGPDAAQEIWAAVYRKLWQLEDARKFRAWLRTLVYFHCVNFARQRSRRQRREVYLDANDWLALSDCVADGASAIEELLEREELRRVVTACLDRLPADYGLMMRLQYISGLSYGEIVNLTGLPMSTVKWRLHDARRLLRDGLAGVVAAHVGKER